MKLRAHVKIPEDFNRLSTFMGFLSFLFGKPKTYDHSSTTPALGSGTAVTRARSSRATILDLRVGAVITYEATDYVVRNRYVYENHGWEWFSYHLVDTISGQKLWIDAEDDDELEVATARPVKMDLELPMADRLFYEGKTYHLDEHGFANVLVESEDSQPHYAKVEFWDFYDSSEEYFLGVERWGNELEVSVGKYIEPYELDILSAGGSDA